MNGHLLHTPGGVVNAAESIVAYLRSKFTSIEVIVPTFAMSAGTMISLAADAVIMGRQSQLGPIDPQMALGGRSVSARAVVEQFERGRSEILQNITVAHVWAPILQSVGPSLLVEAENALGYGQSMVEQWLAKYMFSGDSDAPDKAQRIAKYFNDASVHKSHGRRIGRDEAAAQGLKIVSLEDDQNLQEQVLTAYHLVTIAFERGIATKMMATDTGRNWIKNWANPQDQQMQLLLQRQTAPPAAPGGKSSSRRTQGRRK